MPVQVPDTTLVCVDCQYPRLAARAIRFSLEQCSYRASKLFTDDTRVGRELSPGVELVPIPAIRSTDDYSRFMVKSLLAHVHTRFVQVIQWDGHVLNGSAWTNDFLAYDYVGARWWFREDGRNVGNGGFSLRSRRLLEALQDPEIVVNEPEDNVICLTYRALLESRYGIRFAPGPVADRYAFEGAPPTLREFGFHRLFNFPYFHGEASLAQIIEAIPDDDICSVPMVSLIAILMQLNRTQEAQRYARRMREYAPGLARMPAEIRVRFDHLVMTLDRQKTG